MMTIPKALSSGQAQTYHKLEYTSAAQSYYKQGDEVKGEWQGRLATSLGLSGEVNAREFSRLSEGQHPQTEVQMVRHREAVEYQTASGKTIKAVEHRAGWDATFSAPKSVSLTALVGGDDRVREAHAAAVTVALNELEKYTHARIGGNNPAEDTGKFIAAKFEHDTARPVDGYAAPQLHTHAVIFNVTERADGSTRALQERPFFESKQFATAVYQSELMYRLRDLGYEIEPGKSGAPEIKGFSQSYLDASSLRSQQIKDEMERSGVSGPRAAQIAAHSTRDKKLALTREAVLEAHRNVAAQFGNQPRQVVQEARERAQTQERNPDRATRAKEAMTYARDSLFEREAVVDERLIFRDALRRGMGETTYAEVRADFEARRQRGDLRSVETAKYASGRSFATPETIAAERANIAYVVAGRNAVQPIMSAELAQEQARSRDFLNDTQRRVIEEVLNSTDRIHGLQGRAGSGKTTVLASIREGAEKSGYVVEGFAPTSRASAQLREVGIDATTLQSFLARGDNHPSASPELRHLYMLDESSLASTRQMRAFLDKLNPNDRVLVIGDTRQHQGVDAGKPFEQMQDAGMRTSQLDRIMRQKDSELLKAVEQLAKNNTKQGIDMLASQGRITEITDRQERIAAIARDYASQPENTIVVSPDNRSRQQINEVVRAELLDKGALASDGQTFRTLTHRSDMTGADRTWAARYNVGDVLQYTTGSKAEGIERDSFATVQAVDARANTLTVELANGSNVTYDPRRLRGVQAFRETEREFATGDRIQMTSTNRALGVANRDLGTITAIENGQMSVRMDGKAQRTISFDTAQFRQLDHGYAVTSHSSQGLTAGRVLAHFDTGGAHSLISTRLAYVAISRASDDARVYTNNAETLGQRLATDISKTAAVDFRLSSSTTEVQQAVAAFRANDPATGTAKLQEQGRVHEYASPEHRLAAVALEYTAQKDRAVVVAPEADERRELTQLIREELRHQGRLAPERRSVPVLVEQHLGNRRLAANYAPGDEIHYKIGSPAEHGIADNSTATVLVVDARTNALTVATRDGNETSYNPALLKTQTAQSTIYREEQRDLAVGERITLTASDRDAQIRSGEFATVERIGEDNALSVRLDSGRSVELDSHNARHIEYGYAVEMAQRGFVDRVLVTGDASQLAQQQEVLRSFSPHTRDLTIYTSDSRELAVQKAITDLSIVLSPDGPSSAIDSIPASSLPHIELEGFGIGR
ncbi:MobF family relaxase [Granulicella sp. dw_53]|uniref:MobF family relaxase n=1 Tax=Granulicella sp. dw_53 TaxID=2719792 RepID=UPI001BD69593|nr:MobF family relaxase [Granulicella sp. dw_53]